MAPESPTDTQTETVSQEPLRESGQGLSKLVDWLVAGFLLLWGLTFTVGGLALFLGTDRASVAEWVREGTIRSTELTNAELIDVTYALGRWGGLGVMITGLLIAVASVGFFVYRSRKRRQRAKQGISGPDLWTNAIIGAVVTVVTGFIPFSPVVGGAVAGYLQHGDRNDGLRVGSASGLALAAPLVVLFLFVIGAFAIGLSALNLELGVFFVLVAIVFALVFTVLYLVALGALGGYIGVALAERGDRRSEDPETTA